MHGRDACFTPRLVVAAGLLGPRRVHDQAVGDFALACADRAEEDHAALESGGTSVAELRRMKEIEAEKTKRRWMHAELTLERAAIKDVLHRKSCRAGRETPGERNPDHGASAPCGPISG